MTEEEKMVTEEPKVKIQITTETIKGKELMPGDLFSAVSPEHWGNVNRWDEIDGVGPVGEKVYIRTNAPTPANEKDVEVTLITLSYVRVDGKVRPIRSHESYHMDTYWPGMSLNPKCPYCYNGMEEPKQVSDTDKGKATDATVNRG